MSFQTGIRISPTTTPRIYGSGIFFSSVVGIGLFISALSMTQQQAILGAFLFMAPAVLLSGFATPIENMPSWLRPITFANPLRYFLVVTRGVFLKGMGFADVFQNTVPLFMIAAITLTSAAWRLREGWNDSPLAARRRRNRFLRGNQPKIGLR